MLTESLVGVDVSLNNLVAYPSLEFDDGYSSEGTVKRRVSFRFGSRPAANSHRLNLAQSCSSELVADFSHVVDAREFADVALGAEVFRREAVRSVRVEEAEVEVGLGGGQSESHTPEGLNLDRVSEGVVRMAPAEVLAVEEGSELVDEELTSSEGFG